MAYSLQYQSYYSKRSSHKLMEYLMTCECPFTWRLPSIEPQDVDQYLCIQLQRAANTEEEHQFKWNKFGLDLWLAFELWHQLGDIVSASHHLNICCQHLNHLAESNCSEQLFSSIQGALWHVTLATRAHLLLLGNQQNLAHQVIATIPPTYSLTSSEKAGLLGLKAALCKYYKPKCHMLVLEYAMQACDLDPHQAEWHFLISNSLGRQRRLERGIISDQEVNELHTAYILRRDATYAGHLAQLLAEMAKHIYINRYNMNTCQSPAHGLSTSKVYAKRAIEIFKEGHSLRPHDPLMKIRLAHGLLGLPKQFISKDVFTMIKQMLDEATVHAPNNSMLFHNLGRYYEKFAYDPDQAIYNLEKAHKLGNYHAFLYLINLQWKYGQRKGLIEKIANAEKKYITDANKSELLVYRGALHLLHEDNWPKATVCFIKSIHADASAKHLKNFTGIYPNANKISLLQIVTNEIRMRVVWDNTNRRLYQVFLYKVLCLQPDLLRRPLVFKLYPNFKQFQIHEES